MYARFRNVTDPTIPGLSGRDQAARAVDRVAALIPGRRPAADRRRDFYIRHDLERLDRATLQDLGLDRDRA